jgi:hypothetical protein
MKIRRVFDWHAIADFAPIEVEIKKSIDFITAASKLESVYGPYGTYKPTTGMLSDTKSELVRQSKANVKWYVHDGSALARLGSNHNTLYLTSEDQLTYLQMITK